MYQTETRLSVRRPSTLKAKALNPKPLNTTTADTNPSSAIHASKSRPVQSSPPIQSQATAAPSAAHVAKQERAEIEECSARDVISMQEIINAAAAAVSIEPAWLVKGQGRMPATVYARRLVSAFAREHTQMSFPMIGRKLNQSHSSIIAGHKEYWRLVNGGAKRDRCECMLSMKLLAEKVSRSTGLRMPIYRGKLDHVFVG